MTDPALRRRPIPRLLALALTMGLLMALAASAVAQRGDRGRTYSAHGAWDAELAAVDELLRDGRWKRGLRATSNLKDDILQQATRAPDTREVLTELALQHAIAYANLGERPSAAWYWYTANALDLKVQRRDFSAYGAAAGLFRELEPRALRKVPPPIQVWTDFKHPGFEPPPEKALDLPKSLAGSIVDGRRTPFLLEFILDREGIMRQPVLENDLHPPIVVFHYMDWIWRSGLPPARVDGEPVAILYLMQRNLINDAWVETSRGYRNLPPLEPGRW
ncbi:MAG: hypothetical protein AAGC60_10150 [Acidobacteriota bacterium]